MDPLVGQYLDRYQIVSLLGEGGMGAVYKALDPTLQRHVAIKVLHAQFARQVDFQERFLQEARAAARLDHPGIIKVFDCGKTRGLLYIVMEFIAGDNLRKMLQSLKEKNQWIVLPETIQLVQYICQALSYLHGKGVLHRDIKPDNIMLKTEPVERLPYHPVLTDLGLAKLTEGGVVTQDGSSMGTPAYMSPEQVLSQKTDARSDVYSLGVLLYELAVGRLPFQIRNLSDALRYHVKEQPPEPRFLRPDLPETVARIILKAMQKQPADRFPDAASLAEALVGSMGAATEAAVAPTALTGTVSLMTQYQQSLVVGRGSSILEEFPPTPPDLTQDRIQILDASHTARSVVIKTTGMIIGRAAGNDLVLSGDKISRQHTRIEFDGVNYKVYDLNSTNGTFLANTKLLPGVPEIWTLDKLLRIGDIYLRLERVAQASTAPATQGLGVTGVGGTTRGPVPATQGMGSGRVGVFMPTTEWSVLPGSSLPISVTILNQGTVVDHFRTAVTGIPGDWIPAPPPVVQLLPGAQMEVAITVLPPQNPQSRAGRYNISIQVTSQDAPEQKTEAKATLSVLAFARFTSEMRPQRIRAGHMARIIVTNQGNAAGTFALSWQDPADEIAFSPPRAELTVPEGKVAWKDFRAEPRHKVLIGGSQTHSFVARVQPLAGEPQTHSGELISRARIPTWIIVVFIPLFCLALVAGAGLLPFGPGGKPLAMWLFYKTPTPYPTRVAYTPPSVILTVTPTEKTIVPEISNTPWIVPTDTPTPPNTPTDTRIPTYTPTHTSTSTLTVTPTRTPNPGLGTFQITFQQDIETIVVAFGPTLGGMDVCGFHNLTLIDQDVGKTLSFYTRDISIADPTLRPNEVIEAYLYRSYIGPVTGGSNFDMWNQPNAEVVVGPVPPFDGFTWVVSQPGDYVICLETDYNLFVVPEFGLNWANFTVLLSGG